ncbi:hypothetical protein J3E69DRAFT_367254 [Trichoderma sp. SZMC 28015]
MGISPSPLCLCNTTSTPQQPGREAAVWAVQSSKPADCRHLLTPGCRSIPLEPMKTPEDVHTSVEDMMAYLRWLPTIEKRDNAPSVFPYPVSMTTGKEKSKWMAELEEECATDVKTAKQFFCSASRGKNCILGLGLMPQHNPVADGKRLITETKEWHAFAIAWMKTAEHGRRVLVIWDPDPTPKDSNRSVHLLRGLQVKLLEEARLKCKNTEVYYSTLTKFSGWDQCLKRSFEKLKEWIRSEYDDLFGEEDDQRINDCIRLEK